MDVNSNRFLLAIEYRDPQQKDAGPVGPLAYTYAATLPDALRALLSVPLDQFHPLSARAQQFDRYVAYADIFDMATGKLMLTLLASEKPTQGQQYENAVYLAATNQVSASMLFNTAMELPGQQRDNLNIMPLLRIAADGSHLYPHSIFYSLLDGIRDRLVAPHADLFANNYVVDFRGQSLKNAFINADNELRYPLLDHQHYYEDSRAAFAKMMLTSPAYFDRFTAYKADLNQHFISVKMVRALPEIRVLAGIDVLPVPGPEDPHRVDQAGQYLHVAEGVAGMSRIFGIDLSAFPGWDEHSRSLKLARFGVHVPPHLNVLPVYGKLRASVSEAYGQDGPQMAYDLQTHLKPNLELFAPEERAMAAEQITHFHTDDLGRALTELLTVRAYRFEPHQTKEAGDLSHYLGVRLVNGQNRVLGSFLATRDSQLFGADGLFLGLAPELVAHPDVASLCLQQLAQGGGAYMVPHEGLLYSQVAAYGPNGLRPLAGYNKLSSVMTIHQLNRELTIRPEIKIPAPAARSDQDMFLLRVGYQLMHPRREEHADLSRLYYYKGYPTAENSVHALQSYSQLLFNIQAMKSLDFPFFIREIAVMDSKLDIVLSKERAPDQRSMNFRLHDKADAAMTAAFKKVIGPLEQLLGPSSRPENQKDGLAKRHRRFLPGPWNQPRRKNRGKRP